MDKKILVLGAVATIVILLALGFLMGLFGTGDVAARKDSSSNSGGEASSVVSLADQAKAKCIQLCQSKLDQGISLEQGPCLSNEIVKDWVCDVAHDPRLPVDDDSRNQCPQFGQTASHFIEVDPQCEVIGAY
ncbi:MAG: hypothetical protein JXB14_04060 [Candidatus Altiarchaeota archaeon]|nr:hypothetical protein [Candidatus Altiarchaeota archaeon]